MFKPRLIMPTLLVASSVVLSWFFPEFRHILFGLLLSVVAAVVLACTISYIVFVIGENSWTPWK